MEARRTDALPGPGGVEAVTPRALARLHEEDIVDSVDIVDIIDIVDIAEICSPADTRPCRGSLRPPSPRSLDGSGSGSPP